MTSSEPAWTAEGPRGQPAPRQQDAHESPPPAPPGPVDRWTVLLVDDQKSVRDIAARLLRSLDCDVVEAGSGEEAAALLQARSGAIHLALVDLTMPRLDGEATARLLRSLSSSLPLVLMSGYSEGDVVRRLADVRLAGFLQKPFRAPALQDLLRRLRGG